MNFETNQARQKIKEMVNVMIDTSNAEVVGIIATFFISLSEILCSVDQHKKNKISKDIFNDIEMIINSSKITQDLQFEEKYGARIAIERIIERVDIIKKKYCERDNL